MVEAGERLTEEAGLQTAWSSANRSSSTSVTSMIGPDLAGVLVNTGQSMMRWRSSSKEILLVGSSSKTIPRISLSSSDNGRIDLRKERSSMKALKVDSFGEADFHGLRPQVRLTKITPRDQISFGAEA